MRLISPTRLLLVLTALAAVLIAGCGGSGSGNPDSRLTEQQAKAPISGAPPQLASIRSQANQILDGGTDAFDSRMSQLHGYPVVVNKWASWCGPCQSEFSIFQNVATQRGKQVGFIGLDVNDAEPHARAFLDKRPLPFPSYTDPDEKLTAELKAPQKVAPVTVFVGRDGNIATVHAGAYTSQKQLDSDIDRYLK